MALEESGEKNTDPPEEHIYHIRESACPSSVQDMSTKKCLESRMNGIQGNLLMQRIARLKSWSRTGKYDLGKCLTRSDRQDCNFEAARGAGWSDEDTPVESQDGGFDDWHGTCVHDLHHEHDLAIG